MPQCEAGGDRPSKNTDVIGIEQSIDGVVDDAHKQVGQYLNDAAGCAQCLCVQFQFNGQREHEAGYDSFMFPLTIQLKLDAQTLSAPGGNMKLATTATSAAANVPTKYRIRMGP